MSEVALSPLALAARNIAFLTTTIGYGGAETCLVELAVRLRTRGWVVRVISLRSPTDSGKVHRLVERGIPVASLHIEGTLGAFLGMLRLVRILRSWRPQILHTHMVHANLLGRVARPLSRTPVVVSAARNTYEGPRWRSWAYRVTDFLCDLTVQVSQAGAQRSVATGAVPRSKIAVIPNGVDIRRFAKDTEARQEIRARLGANGRFVWLAVARLELSKDYPSALEALASVRTSEPDTVLWIAGEGELEGVLRQLAEEKGVDRSVVFMGHQSDIPGLMSAADGYLMSSAWEGMPNVLLEAAAACLPAVATCVGGNPEVVLESKTGFLVPPRDPGALASAMLRLMTTSSEDLVNMGLASRAHVCDHFEIEGMVDQWEVLYKDLLSRRIPA